MEDVPQKVWVNFEHADLQRLRRILTLNLGYRLVCEQLVELEDRALARAVELEEAIWPNAQNLPEKLPMKERVQEVMKRYCSLPTHDGLFTLETREQGFIDAWLLELDFEIQIESDDPRFAGTRKMTLYLLHPERQKAVLYCTNENDGGEEWYSFAVWADLNEHDDRQEVPFAVCEGEFYGATDAIHGFILQDSGRVDA